MKKITAILTALALILVFCGCDGTSKLSTSIITPIGHNDTVSIDEVNGTEIEDIFPDNGFAWLVAVSIGRVPSDKVTSKDLAEIKGDFDCEEILEEHPEASVGGTVISEISLLVGIGKLTGITSFSLEKAKVKEIPAEIGDCTELVELDLEGCTYLDTLPEAIGQLSKLEKLDLSDTTVSNLPDQICECTSLKKIDLSGTSLTELPENIGNLIELDVLNLHSSILTVLPESITKLKKLRSLDCGSTALTAIPSDIANMESLVRADFSSCHIKYVPEGAANLKKIKYFNVSGNVNIDEDYIFILPYDVYSCTNDPDID